MIRSLLVPFASALLCAFVLAACGEPAPARSPTDTRAAFPERIDTR